jgi:alanine dehydrogenase
MDVGCAVPGVEEDRRFTWGAMAGIIPHKRIFALRQKLDIHHSVTHGDGHRTREKYCVEPGTYCGFITLVDTLTGEPLAFVNDGVLQHLRVAGTAAVAARHLARTDSTVLALLGSGGMAHAHARMLDAVLPIERIQVYSPTKAHRERFAGAASEELGIEVLACDSAAVAVAGADVVAFTTDSLVPVFADNAWVEPGMHCTNVLLEEVGPLAERADVIVLHERAKAVGTWVGPGHLGAESFDMARFPDLPILGEFLIAEGRGRANDQEVTYFHNQPGAGIQFAALGAELLERARLAGTGTEIPTSWFLQDIRN